MYATPTESLYYTVHVYVLVLHLSAHGGSATRVLMLRASLPSTSVFPIPAVGWGTRHIIYYIKKIFNVLLDQHYFIFTSSEYNNLSGEENKV